MAPALPDTKDLAVDTADEDACPECVCVPAAVTAGLSMHSADSSVVPGSAFAMNPEVLEYPSSQDLRVPRRERVLTVQVNE